MKRRQDSGVYPIVQSEGLSTEGVHHLEFIGRVKGGGMHGLFPTGHSGRSLDPKSGIWSARMERHRRPERQWA